jgi:hypothetical protein
LFFLVLKIKVNVISAEEEANTTAHDSMSNTPSPSARGEKSEKSDAAHQTDSRRSN